MILVTGGLGMIGAHTARALTLLMTAKQLRYDTYNVSGGRPYSNRELAEASSH
jgi:nucleoside-diphosphate-sugar epimerase